MRSNRTLSLLEFVRSLSPDLCEKIAAIDVSARYPFLRSDDGSDALAGVPVTELPFAVPDQAKAAFEKNALQSQIWEIACDAVIENRWQCRARRENEIRFEEIPGKVLLRSTPDLTNQTLMIFGELFDDVEFLCHSPETSDDRALRIIKQFCSNHDPKAHQIQDIRTAITEGLGLDMTTGHVRDLMRQASLDKAWFAPGRRTARKT